MCWDWPCQIIAFFYILLGCREEVMVFFFPLFSLLWLTLLITSIGFLCRSPAKILYTDNLPKEPDDSLSSTKLSSIPGATPSVSGASTTTTPPTASSTKKPSFFSSRKSKKDDDKCVHQWFLIFIVVIWFMISCALVMDMGLVVYQAAREFWMYKRYLLWINSKYRQTALKRGKSTSIKYFLCLKVFRERNGWDDVQNTGNKHKSWQFGMTTTTTVSVQIVQCLITNCKHQKLFDYRCNLFFF